LKRDDYLKGDVAHFSRWLAERLCGCPINFSVLGHDYQALYDALSAYRWPQKRVIGLPNSHDGNPYVHPVVASLPRASNLAANTSVLNVIQRALRAAFKADPHKCSELAGAVAAVFHWGGVNAMQLARADQALDQPHMLGTQLRPAEQPIFAFMATLP